MNRTERAMIINQVARAYGTSKVQIGRNGVVMVHSVPRTNPTHPACWHTVGMANEWLAKITNA